MSHTLGLLAVAEVAEVAEVADATDAVLPVLAAPGLALVFGAPGAPGAPGGPGATPGRCSIVDSPDRDGSEADLPTAIPSATRSSAARIIDGSGVSTGALIEPIRAPAEAAVEHPAGRAVSSGSVGALVSERHRSSHSSMVPPQPLTYAESTGRSGSVGPVSAALMRAYG